MNYSMKTVEVSIYELSHDNSGGVCMSYPMITVEMSI